MLAITLPALAQQEVKQDGRLLDKNLRVGSGGYNEPGRDPYQNRANDIINGNVTGLGYFHGNIPYAPNDSFRGRLPSDTLFRFNSQSAPSNPFINEPGGYAPPDSIRRASSFSPLQEDGNYYQPGGENRWDGTYRYTDLAGQSANPLITGQSRTYNAISSRVDDEGRTHQITLSPLLGVRQNVKDYGFTSNTLPTPNLANTQSTADENDDQTPRTSARWDGQQLKGNIRDNNTQTQPATASEIGRIANAMVSDERLGQHVRTIDDRLAQIQASLFTPQGTRQASPGDDVYMKLLEQARQAKELAAGGKPTTPLFPPDQLAQEIKQTATGRDILEQNLSPEDLKAAQQARRQAFLTARGVATQQPEKTTLPDQHELALDPDQQFIQQILHPPGSNPAPGSTPGSTPGSPNQATAGNPAQPGLDAAATAQSPDTQLPKPISPDDLNTHSEEHLRVRGRLNAILKSMEYDLPVVQSLAGQTDNKVNQALTQGEQQLAAGQYFDAVRSYRSALNYDPNHTMARVGLIHASLGAGLIRSAALELRRLFDEHPQLIATRYDPQLLPSPERLKWVCNELDKSIKATNLTDPAIMMAYLGYQMRSDKTVHYGLDLAATRDPNDPLVPILQSVWLKKVNPE
ncbi:MAG: hypothetical protein GC164_15685 [Phycisphaera sp.]|nr:hypothetical protein [Phycisphaera sp.]